MLKRKNKRMKDNHVIPDGLLMYNDLFKPEKTLYSSQHGLCGKPDYIMKNRDGFIPVEVKTGNHNSPQKHHIMQLMSYCQIVEDYYGQTVPYGILVYYDTKKQFSICFNDTYKSQLNQTINFMRNISKDQWDNHIDRLIDSAKCKNCSMKTFCGFFKGIER